MRTIVQNFFLLITLLIISGSVMHAEESNITNIEKAWNYGSVLEQKSSSQEETYSEDTTIALIENNRQYVIIAAALYAFSLIIITLLIFIKRQDCHAKDLVTIIGLVSVIFGMILLVLVVDTTDSLTAPMGVFGAIAGYLFGAAQKKEASGEE